MTVRRREFITLLGGAAAWPLGVRAQQAAMPVIGMLNLPGPPPGASLEYLRRTLMEHGYVEGRNVSIEYRGAENHAERIAALAADLVRSRVALIVTLSEPSVALAAIAATTTIPIVFTSGSDPVRDGLVTSLNRPGGNATGVTFFAGELGPKRLELLRELVPRGSLIAALSNLQAKDAKEVVKDLEAAAHGVGQEIAVLTASSPSEIDQAFANMNEGHVGGLVVTGNGFLANRVNQITSLAARYRIPTIYFQRSFVEAGGLMSYGDDRLASWRQVANYIDRILKGEKAGDLPVVRPTKFDLVINLKTAQMLGLVVPPTLRVLPPR
jgi:putative ABC transport system substrate-binding protein